MIDIRKIKLYKVRQIISRHIIEIKKVNNNGFIRINLSYNPISKISESKTNEIKQIKFILR